MRNLVLSIAVLAIGLCLSSIANAYTEEQLREAFSRGYAQGWAACEASACGHNAGSNGMGKGTKFIWPDDKGVWNGVPKMNGNGLGGDGAGYELPPSALKELGIETTIRIPKGWAVLESHSGPAIVGSYSNDVFKPYVIGRDGKFEALSKEETPSWALDMKVLNGVAGSRKLQDGLMLLNVQPQQK